MLYTHNLRYDDTLLALAVRRTLYLLFKFSYDMLFVQGVVVMVIMAPLFAVRISVVPLFISTFPIALEHAQHQCYGTTNAMAPSTRPIGSFELELVVQTN